MTELITKILDLLDYDLDTGTELMEQIIQTKSVMESLLNKLRKASVEKNHDRSYGEQLYQNLIDEFAKLK